MTCEELHRDEEDPLIKGVRREAAREKRWQREGEPSVSRRLAQIGVLGWLVVVPMLIAVLAGRWLDQRFDSGLECTAPLLILGVGIGCWSGWKWMNSA